MRGLIRQARKRPPRMILTAAHEGEVFVCVEVPGRDTFDVALQRALAVASREGAQSLGVEGDLR